MLYVDGKRTKNQRFGIETTTVGVYFIYRSVSMNQGQFPSVF